jgi:EAL domain-containing protein (putative c-di-GMP-specific phosphodiesterase class I)
MALCPSHAALAASRSRNDRTLRFIPVAEEAELIGAISTYVLRRACADAIRWPEKVKVAVNLSPLQFRTGNLLQTVIETLEESGLAPKRLELEITETLLLEKSDHVLATLHALRALGGYGSRWTISEPVIPT